MPCHGQYITTLHAAFCAQPDLTFADTLDGFLTLQDATVLWQDLTDPADYPAFAAVTRDQILISLSQVRYTQRQPRHHDIPVQIRRSLLVDQLWYECSVPVQLRHQLQQEHSRKFLIPPLQQPVWIEDAIFLYVFSGRRRPGDYQDQVEAALRRYGISGRVLLLDLAISDEHDVSQHSVIHTLQQWLQAGRIAALLVAPPCETWSEARYNQLEASAAPRPLRTSQDPICMDGLSLNELEQVATSNFLLYVTLKLLWTAFLCKVPGTLEHPKEPRNKSRPSVRRLPWLKLLRDQGHLCQHLIWQAHYGARSPKPTNLGTVHLPHFAQIMRLHRQPVNWNELELEGNNRDGSWKTSQAKEYPIAMNAALADAHVREHMSRKGTAASLDAMTEADLEKFEHLYEGDKDMQQQQMQPDYHHRKAQLSMMD